MQYGELITRAWTIVWRHRYLWLLGALGGGEAGTNFGGFGNVGNGANFGGGRGQVGQWVQQALPLLLGLGIVLFVVAIAYFLISCVATGALVRAAAEHDAERPFGLRMAWHVGTRKFAPILGLRLLAFVIVLVVAIVLTGLVLAGVASLSGGGAAVLGALAIALAVLLVIALIPAAIAFSLVLTLATRAIVLEERRVFDALGRAVRLLSARLGRVLLVWLLGLLLGLAVGVITGIALAVAAIPLALVGVIVYAGFGTAATLTAAIPLVIVFALAAIAVSGAAGSYISTYWTLAFRRLELDAPPAPTYAYPVTPAG
jgi:hypothetical protein